MLTNSHRGEIVEIRRPSDYIKNEKIYVQECTII